MIKRTILITGCSSGIGFVSARMMKARGWRVIATARAPEDLRRLQADEGLEAVALELRDHDSIAQCATKVLEMCGGRLDALFNNAAFGQVGAMEDISGALLRDQLEVNVIGTHELTRRIIPAMRQAGSGRIVMCSSVLGFAAGPYRGAYCASKFALEGLTDALRLELHDTGIGVSLIEPGPIRSNFVATALAAFKANIDIENSPHREIYLKRVKSMEAGGRALFKLEPDAVARKLVHAVESAKPKRRYYVTTLSYVALIAKQFAPPAVLDSILRRM